MVAMPTHIDFDKAKQTYRIRIPIPKELQSAFGGQRNLIRGLGRDKLAAGRKADELRPQLYEMIRQAQAGEYPPIEDWQCEVIAYKWRGWAMEQQEASEESVDPEFATPQAFQASVNRYLSTHMPDIRLTGGNARKITGYCRGECRISSGQTHVPVSSPPVTFSAPAQAAPGAQVYRFRDMHALWVKERKRGKKTQDEYLGKLDKLAKFLGQDDASRVTTADMIRWKEALIDEYDKPKTIENHIIVIKSLFRLAFENKKIPTNPTEGVRYSGVADPKKKRRGFTIQEELPHVLRLARKEKGGQRWLPWLAAFMGGRLGEISDAMANHVVQRDGVWGLDIQLEGRAETASLKLGSDSEHFVPFHRDLIREGILDYVKKLPKDGPLFPDIPPGKTYGKRADNATKRNAYWVRHTCGITDKRIAPMHSWRHTFKTLCRDAAIPKDYHDYITGHKSGEAGDDYGLYSPKAVKREIDKIRIGESNRP